MSTATENVQEENVTEQLDAVIENIEPTDQVQEERQEERQEEKVPLSALQKERKKRQEWEQRAKLYEQEKAQQLSTPQQSVEEDEDQYEALTKAEYKKQTQQQKNNTIRDVMEALWAKQNPDKVHDVQDRLEELIKTKPHLRLAIEAAPNRYEEAWILLNALTPRQRASLKPSQTQKKPAPGSPTSVPKSAGMNESVNLMTMTDAEFNEWRKSKRRSR